MRVRPIPAAVQHIENTGATQRSDFQPIFNRLLPKCVCLRGSVTAPPKPPAQWRRLGHTCAPPPLSHIPGSATETERFISSPRFVRSILVALVLNKFRILKKRHVQMRKPYQSPGQDEKLILLYCPGRGLNSRPPAHRSFKHGQGVPRP